MLSKIKNEKNISYALNVVLSWLFSLSIASGILYLTILDTTFAELAVMTFRVALIFAVILYNKYTMAAFALIAAIVTVYVYRALTDDYPPPFLLERAENIYRTWMFMTGELSFTRALNDSALQLIVFVIGTCSAILLRLKFSYLIIFGIGAGVFLTANIAHPDGRHYAFFLLLLTLILIYIKRNKNSAKNIVVLAPVCALMIILAGTVPMPDTTEGRRFLEDLYEEVFWVVRSPFMPRYFSAQWLGFEARDGTLGGNLNQSGDFIMWVFADEPLYLTGATKSIYTGRSWLSRHEDEYFTERDVPDFSGMRNFELMMWDGGRSPQWDFERGEATRPANMRDVELLVSDGMFYAAEARHVSINIGRVRTGTVFRPPGSLDLRIYGDYDVLQRGQDLRVAPTFGRNAAYSFLFHTVDIEDYYIQSILAQSRRGFYEERLAEMQEFLAYVPQFWGWSFAYIVTSNIYENIRIPYAQYVHENYTALPDTLPDRVRYLTYSITANYDTDFDRAMAIKYFLRTFPYSRTPGDLPYGRDFVDYFLFDVREGYCTYFATAMAVMARVIGIPSRYNIGFMLPENQVLYGLFSVYGTNAHAWAELYFEGVGWIIFEATPPYQPELAYIGGVAAGLLDDWDQWFWEDLYEMEWLLNFMDGEFAPGMGMQAVLPGQEAARTEIHPMIVVAVGAVLALGTHMFIKKASEDNRHKKINDNQYRESVVEGFRGLVELLSFYGLSMNDHESAIGYTKRIEKLAPLGTMQLRTSAEIFSRARYSEIEMNKEDAEFIKKNYFFMYKKMKESDRKIRFFVHRYIRKFR